jgi:multiple sugar transport system permease protein
MTHLDIAEAPAVTRRAGFSFLLDGRLLLGPAVLLLLLMTIAPALYLFGASLLNFNLLSPEQVHFVGLQNYVDLFTSSETLSHLLVTFVFVALVVAIELVIALPLALMLNRPGLDVKIASSLLLLPMAVTPVVAALVFRSLLNPLYGWVDYYLQAFGLTQAPIEWLSVPITAWISIVALDVWQFTPFVALILLAGLQGLSKETAEAAAADGAASCSRSSSSPSSSAPSTRSRRSARSRFSRTAGRAPRRRS